MKQDKPRIFWCLVARRWICVDSFQFGTGETPKDAYYSWRRRQIKEWSKVALGFSVEAA